MCVKLPKRLVICLGIPELHIAVEQNKLVKHFMGQEDAQGSARLNKLNTNCVAEHQHAL